MAINSESQHTCVIGYDEKFQSFEFTSQQLAKISRHNGQTITLVTEHHGKLCSKDYEVRLNPGFSNSTWDLTPVPENWKGKWFERLNTPPKPHREMIKQLATQLNDSFKLWDLLMFEPAGSALELKPRKQDDNTLSEKHWYIKKFIEEHHTVETPHTEGLFQRQTPLQYCCGIGDKTAAKLLVDGGADTEYRLNTGMSEQSPALHIAVRKNNPDLLRYLLSVKAKRDSIDDKGRTPLHIAAQYNANRVTQLLMFPSTDLDVRDNQGKTPLHLAIMAGHLQIAEILIDLDADLNAKDKRGQTPLHLAAKQGDQATFEFLLGKGARWDIRDNRQHTPLARVQREHKLTFTRLVESKFVTQEKAVSEVASNAEDESGFEVTSNTEGESGFEVVTIEPDKPKD